ncbi:tRNA (adenosine(37)-N6)-threonylcarbamoyltransferase complex ATPase subunit type 1 TsaE [filamentous cyanobacterium LEGE 11480]|uniref:tRNA threonylcarbamoyladenosine biosynthesis protein TsaE n=1 Tax=Romeriopsis navalis LEGE 11480 TaxID=2777977 RepID=A0A928VL08_9CYAN|nr:tRNA (adenosine(37)-N6)-threonylcarbamoyltransferase complex ATPase subunit type 1 TsaE [Romeriopsis navalis]MBE9028556.1 tRNA (adenosine(37)-N6)-threonylcarbamoyltransferase complex ATPase subunit type 1 TsaE [Romeriopsis navalis LEGE 11480]
MSFSQQLANAAATHEIGRQLGAQLAAGAILLLEGDLGAGKTSLVQGIGTGLGISETIDSPTFTLINEYDDGRVPLYHLDLYRLEPAEVTGLNLDSYWEGIETEPGIVAIEWAERLPYLPQDYLRIKLTHDAAGGRKLVIEAIGQIAVPTLTR